MPGAPPSRRSRPAATRSSSAPPTPTANTPSSPLIFASAGRARRCSASPRPPPERRCPPTKPLPSEAPRPTPTVPRLRSNSSTPRANPSRTPLLLPMATSPSRCPPRVLLPAVTCSPSAPPIQPAMSPSSPCRSWPAVVSATPRPTAIFPSGRVNRSGASPSKTTPASFVTRSFRPRVTTSAAVSRISRHAPLMVPLLSVRKFASAPPRAFSNFVSVGTSL